MSPIRFHIPKTRARSHLLQVDEGASFYAHLHVHPEIQITAIERGQGRLTAGSVSLPFVPGEVWIFGSDLPHMLRNERPGVLARSIFLEPPTSRYSLLALPEMGALCRRLPLRQAARVRPPFAADAFRQIRDIHDEAGAVARLRLLLALMEWLAESRHVEVVHHAPHALDFGLRDKRLLDQVFAYGMRHYQRPIRLEEVAALVHMHPTAFARLFKARTGRSFISWLNEVRVHAACRLLENAELRISEAAFQAGFRNLSHFNALFRRITGLTPRQWRKRHGGIS